MLLMDHFLAVEDTEMQWNRYNPLKIISFDF